MLIPELFKVIVQSTPLVSIDLIIRDDDSNILLGKRTNRPAQGFWFVPGGRILKNETMENAFNRISINELGIPLVLSKARLIGQFEHFYNDSIFGNDISTHYIVMAYQIEFNERLCKLPFLQHSCYKWFTLNELLIDKSVHSYTKAYFK